MPRSDDQAQTAPGVDLLAPGAPEAEPTMRALLSHAEYLNWAHRAAQRANEEFARTHRTGVPLFSAGDLHFHLYDLGIEEGWIITPKRLRRPYSFYVAQAFEYDAEQVKQAARRFWRHRIKQREQERSA